MVPPVILTFLFFGNNLAFSTKTDKNLIKNCHRRQGTLKRGSQRRRFLDKPAKIERIVEILLEMEDVPGKKVLDFFGRIVHNGGYPLDRTNNCVAKRTSKTEKTAVIRRNENAFRRIGMEGCSYEPGNARLGRQPARLSCPEKTDRFRRPRRSGAGG